MLKTSLAATLFAIAVAPTVLAAPDDYQVEVRFAAEDLRNPARVREIEARIEAAAEEACRDRLLGDLLRPYSLRACIAETTETAMEDLQSRIASTTIAGPNQVD